mmetsp:Transcript_139426/g.347667  ORF Transcript_139426/g.347667 Transcript_139426/m.347667 type:complete len:94 (-) Transcript_139426:764-1045(-)
MCWADEKPLPWVMQVGLVRQLAHVLCSRITSEPLLSIEEDQLHGDGRLHLAVVREPQHILHPSTISMQRPAQARMYRTRQVPVDLDRLSEQLC